MFMSWEVFGFMLFTCYHLTVCLSGLWWFCDCFMLVIFIVACFVVSAVIDVWLLLFMFAL